jgi:hypothetical protein
VLSITRLTHAFLPGRGRYGNTFAPGGQFTKLAITPTNCILSLPGHWRWVSGCTLQLMFEDPSQQYWCLDVLTLTPGVLKAKAQQPH